MLITLVSMSSDQVYKFDQGIFNWESVVITVLGVVVALLAIGATLVGYVSLKKYKAQMDNLKETFNSKVNEFKEQSDKNLKMFSSKLNELKEQSDKSLKKISRELIRTKMYNAHMVSNSVITLFFDTKPNVGAIINALREFYGTIPNTFEEPGTFVSYLNYFDVITDVVAENFDKIKHDGDKSEAYKFLNAIDKKLSEKYVKNMEKISDKNDREREKYHYGIRKNMVNIENQLKNKSN